MSKAIQNLQKLLQMEEATAKNSPFTRKRKLAEENIIIIQQKMDALFAKSNNTQSDRKIMTPVNNGWIDDGQFISHEQIRRQVDELQFYSSNNSVSISKSILVESTPIFVNSQISQKQEIDNYVSFVQSTTLSPHSDSTSTLSVDSSDSDFDEDFSSQLTENQLLNPYSEFEIQSIASSSESKILDFNPDSEEFNFDKVMKNSLISSSSNSIPNEKKLKDRIINPELKSNLTFKSFKNINAGSFIIKFGQTKKDGKKCTNVCPLISLIFGILCEINGINDSDSEEIIKEYIKYAKKYVRCFIDEKRYENIHDYEMEEIDGGMRFTIQLESAVIPVLEFLKSRHIIRNSDRFHFYSNTERLTKMFMKRGDKVEVHEYYHEYDRNAKNINIFDVFINHEIGKIGHFTNRLYQLV